MATSQSELQTQIIEKVSTILRKYPSVAAFSLGGSHAVDDSTAFSDVDFTIVFATDERERLKEIFAEVVSIEPVLSSLYLLYDNDCLVLFENGVRLDMQMVKPSDYREGIIKKVKALYDPEGIIIRQYENSMNKIHPRSQPKWNDNEGVYLDWYFWMFRQSYCYAIQSELKPEKSFDKMYSSQTSLASIRQGLIDMLYYVHGFRDYLGNIDQKIAESLRQSFVDSSVDHILAAIRELVAVYENIGHKFAQKAEVEFPRHKVVHIIKLFDEFDRERSSAK